MDRTRSVNPGGWPDTAPMSAEHSPCRPAPRPRTKRDAAAGGAG